MDYVDSISAWENKFNMRENSYREVQTSVDTINLSELFSVLWKNKLLIICISFAFALASGFYALSLHNVYSASTLLAPVSENSNQMSGLSSQFGGLASIAGINLNNSDFDKTTFAIEVIKSRVFLESFIKKNNLKPYLFAVEGWDKENNKLIYNANVYDESKKVWIASDINEPSLWQAYQKLFDIISITKDKANSYITITINYYSPELARTWLLQLITDINDLMRNNDVRDSRLAIEYLNEKLAETKVSSMEAVFYQLIEQQTKNMMLASIKDDYVFKVIEPPQVPELKESPKRALIVLLGAILGGLFSVFFVLIRYFFCLNNPAAKTN